MQEQLTETITGRMDHDTLDHCFATHRLALEFEKAKGIDNDLLSTAAAYHDVGKIYISGNVLNKKADEPLTQIEKDIISAHPYFGYRLLKEIGVDDKICNIVLYHHGSIPSHFVEENELPKPTEEEFYLSNILYGLDVYTALIQIRPYRSAYSRDDAIRIIKADKKQHVDLIRFLENYR